MSSNRRTRPRLPKNYTSKTDLLNGYSENLADMHKLKELGKKQELVAKELESQDIKAQHMEYMVVRVASSSNA